MIEDPLTTWPGQFPYRVLAGVGITPQSTQAEVNDVAFTLMAEGMMNPTTQQAWHQLRDVTRRLLVDLLLYDIDQEADIGRMADHVTQELANPGEPPEVTEVLTTIPVEVMACLADELTDLHIRRPEPPKAPADLCAFPTPSFTDSLIQFDR
ncbi:MAG TPA: hypothetical protein VJT49_32985 [Amycolatopsis sp.]|uniref:hypothetical protein n=1 Tax=Amycolatopsis sp. TaxID=37632 RepID=UPI002B4A87D1|nr:hypothetical protein [Amycolatopsis sp.]HKS49840.1 hypothetical protein [Amycolatopsis sp.]